MSSFGTIRSHLDVSGETSNMFPKVEAGDLQGDNKSKTWENQNGKLEVIKPRTGHSTWILLLCLSFVLMIYSLQINLIPQVSAYLALAKVSLDTCNIQHSWTWNWQLLTPTGFQGQGINELRLIPKCFSMPPSSLQAQCPGGTEEKYPPAANIMSPDFELKHPEKTFVFSAFWTK